MFSIGAAKPEKALIQRVSGMIRLKLNEKCEANDTLDDIERKKDESYMIMVNEVQCNDPGCVPIETLIIVLLTNESGKDKKFVHKILKPLCEVTENDVSLIDFLVPVIVTPVLPTVQTPMLIPMKKKDSATPSTLGVAATLPDFQVNSIESNESSGFDKEKMRRKLEIDSGSAYAPDKHKGGVRPRGCPCCDPDNLDNIIDKMLFINSSV